MNEGGKDSDFSRGNLDASQSAPAKDFDYANIDPVLFNVPQIDTADTNTTDSSLLNTPTSDTLLAPDTDNTHLPVPYDYVLPFRPLHNTYPSAQVLYSPEQITFSEMVTSGWIQESDAYVLRLDIPSTLTPSTSHLNIPRFHTKVFYAYVSSLLHSLHSLASHYFQITIDSQVTKVDNGKAFVSPDGSYLESIEVRDPQEIVEAMGRENFKHLGSFCEMQDPWILEVVRLGCSRGTLREDRERCWRWKSGQ
ncbi:hypothetical protein MMC15_005042 [Xylographa vitiligo]|nr:hypothetical protein [Xylographa vitiligo]